MTRITLSGGTTRMVSDAQAKRFLESQAMLKPRNVMQELRDARLAPRGHRNSTGSLTVSSHCSKRGVEKVTQPGDLRKEVIQARWDSLA